MSTYTPTLPWAAQVGRVWFRWRSFSPLPFFLLMVVLPPDFVPSVGVRILTLLGLCLAEGLRLWAVGHAGSATRTRGDTVPVLVHSGPFRYVRNPLYIANLALYSLVGVLFGFVWLSLLTLIFSAIEYVFIVRYEEHILAGTFGGTYDHYTSRVPRWIPSLSPRVDSSHHEFDLKRAFQSERSTLLSISAMACLLWIKSSLSPSQ